MPHAMERETQSTVALMPALRPLLGGRRQAYATGRACSRLIRLHRHSLFHLLLEGGTARARERLAIAFHRGSPLRRGPFLRLGAGGDGDRFGRALEPALSPG